MEYAIKIDGRYFKEYIYYNEHTKDRFGGHTALGGLLRDGDIVDVVLTDKIERTSTRRGLGNTISVLYSIKKLRGKKIEIIPLEGKRNGFRKTIQNAK